MTLTVAALCMGTGALEMGLQLAGIDCELAWCAEIDPHASKVIAHRWPGVPNLGDLTKITDPEPVDIVTAGFPCTDISSAGRKAGIHGEHSGLWWNVADLVGELRPRTVVLENVADIATRGGTAVVGALAGMGYRVRWGTLRAADVGAPHGRARWFAVAHADERRCDGLAEPDGEPTQRPAVQLGHDAHRCGVDRDQAGVHRPALEPARSSADVLARWASIVGRSAPGVHDGARLREWMMGLPEGHVTDVPDLSRAQMLRALGNGVCVQQGAAAIRALT